jgi:hypothetical protein
MYHCPHCDTVRYRYHSCRNRHCPTCQHDATQTWLRRHADLLLPVPYFLVTFTLPAALRPVARRAPRPLYDLLFRTSAAALQELAQDPRFLGGRIGMLGVLHTWTRDLRYHPHVHYLVPALALAPDGETWLVGRRSFLVHAKPLARLFQAKFRAAYARLPHAPPIPATTWQQPWVVDCRPVGNGVTALRYLAPYIFRIALSNNRLDGVQDDQVTFRYRDAATGTMQRCTLPVMTFLDRFLAHVLPKGFVKVRSYGLLRVGNRQQLRHARAVLMATAAVPTPDLEPPGAGPITDPDACPQCGQPMQLVQAIPRTLLGSDNQDDAPPTTIRGPPRIPERARSMRCDQVCNADLGRRMEATRTSIHDA